MMQVLYGIYMCMVYVCVMCVWCITYYVYVFVLYGNICMWYMYAYDAGMYVACAYVCMQIQKENNIQQQAACWFPDARLAQPQNNHTETVLIKTLLDPLALTSYWLTLTY